MITNLLILTLTAFISVNGQVKEVETTSEEYKNYIENAVTDIGNPDNLVTVSETSVSGGDALPTTTEQPTETETPTTYVVVEDDNEEEIALMTTMVDLLAENSDSATGTVNSTILTLMDRMVNNYPAYYKYAGFRTDSDDSYSSTLYISKRADVSGSIITFGDDCVAVDFYRVTTDNYSGYLVYNVSESPNASVTVNSNTIVYTNAIDGYPSLGTKSQFPEEWLWIGLLAVAVIIIFTRRNN